jgi:hypothetical protein
MESSSNKKFSFKSPQMTHQEFTLRQSFIFDNIPFEYQKVFSLSDRFYVVDFFIADSIILECSYTQSFSYHVTLRHKAKLLEQKLAILKREFNHSIWVLLESERPISRRFSRSLKRFMPSVDQIMTSIVSLIEILRVNLSKSSKIAVKNSNLSLSNQFFSSNNEVIPLNSNNVTKNNSFSQNHGHNNVLHDIYSFFNRHNNKYSIQEKIKNKKKSSNNVNLKFFRKNDKIKTNPTFLEEGLIE